MLRQFRVAAKTTVAKVIIGALVAAFALWGVSDIFRGSVSDTVAEVGNTELTSLDLSRELRARMRQMSQQMNMQLTLEQARQFGLDKTVLEELISRTALDEAAAGLGLTASDENTLALIRSAPGFDAAQLAQYLRDNGYTEGAYLELARKDVARSQLMDSVALGTTPPSGLTAMLHDMINETRVVDYIVLTPEDAGEIAAPTEEEVTAFHTAHPELFSALEYRQIQYVVIGPEQVTGQIEVTEDEIRQEFENPQTPFNTPEQRDIQQITFPDQASAEAASMRIASEGIDFLTLAQERGLSADDIARGTLTAEQLGGALAEAAFALPEGGVTPPLQGPFGWVLLRVASITPGSARSFEEAHDDIRQTLVSNRATVFMTDMANAFEDARAGGAIIPDAAMNLNIPSHSVAAVDSQGLAPDGVMADIPADPAFIQQVFATVEGEESYLFQGEGGIYYAVRIDSITPETLRPLDTVRLDVERGWTDEARATALQKRATVLAEEARMIGLEAVAATLGRMIVTSVPLSRSAFDETLGAQVIQEIFSVPQGGILAGESADGVNYVVARIGQVDHPVADTAAPEYMQFREAMAGQMAQDLIQALAVTARDQAGVTTYPDTIETALGQGLLY